MPMASRTWDLTHPSSIVQSTSASRPILDKQFVMTSQTGPHTNPPGNKCGVQRKVPFVPTEPFVAIHPSIHPFPRITPYSLYRLS